MSPRFATGLCALLLLSGCGEMMFKRGAGPGEMAAAQQDCAKASEPEARKACLEGKGFAVAANGDALFTAPKVVLPAAVKPKVSAAQAAPATPTAQATASGAPGAELESAPAPAAPRYDPLQEVSVGSWWKLGGSPGALAQAQADCVKTLGNAHRPAADSHLVTNGLLECLRAKGWLGLGR